MLPPEPLPPEPLPPPQKPVVATKFPLSAGNRFSLFSTSNWKIIIDIIPVVGILFPLLGIFKAIVYYNYFGINIIEYISFGEIITLFLPDILDLASLLAIIVFFEWHFIRILKDFTEDDDFRVAKWVPYLIGSLCIIGWVIAFAYKVYYQYSLDIPYAMLREKTSFFPYVTFICFFVFFHVMAIEYQDRDKLVGKYVENMIFYFVIFFSGIVLYKGLDKAVNKWEFPEKQPIMTFETKQGKLTNSADTIYVGRTNQFLFFFLKKKSESMVLPTEEVLRIHTKKIRFIDTIRKYPTSTTLFP